MPSISEGIFYGLNALYVLLKGNKYIGFYWLGSIAIERKPLQVQSNLISARQIIGGKYANEMQQALFITYQIFNCFQ